MRSTYINILYFGKFHWSILTYFLWIYYMLQVEVVKSFNDSDGPQWKYSLFGNPNDLETFRCVFSMKAGFIRYA